MISKSEWRKACKKYHVRLIYRKDNNFKDVRQFEEFLEALIDRAEIKRAEARK